MPTFTPDYLLLQAMHTAVPEIVPAYKYSYYALLKEERNFLNEFGDEIQDLSFEPNPQLLKSVLDKIRIEMENEEAVMAH